VLTSCRTARIRADVIQLLSVFRKRYWLPGRFLPPLSQVGHLASGTASPAPIWPLAWSWGSLQPCQREVRRTWICYASGMRTACCRMLWEAESSSFWCVYIKCRSSPWCQLFVQVWDHPGALQIFIMRNLTVERSASCSGKIWLDFILLLLSKFPFLDSALQKDQDFVGRDTLAGDNLQEEGFLRRCSHGMSLGNDQQESCP
jgi:hypothetical protein